jgi:hypothetical protein
VPFKLTRAQERVWREIAHDLKRASPMQRLLQGDVGSGKTIVAALAALQAIESGKQVAFMAPDGNTRRAALPQAGFVAGRTRRAHCVAFRFVAGEGAQRRDRRRWRAEQRSSRSAPTRCSRKAWTSRSSASRSSTSSIASASHSVLRCAARAWPKRTS